MTYSSRQKWVIVNADDLGFSSGVTEGILRAHAAGVVTSTTIVANMPAAAEAMARLGEAPELGVGVHLNASQGRPLSQAGLALADEDGVMRQTAIGLIKACCRRPALLRAVEAEFDAQICWVLDRGLRPTHLDSHRHAHAFTPIFRRVVELAERYGIRFVRWHREILPGRGWPKATIQQRLNSRILNGCGLINAWVGPHLHATHGTWGIAHTGRIDSAWLIQAARKLPVGGIEIMTHPGLAADLDAPSTRLVQCREAELAALCDPNVKEAFRLSGARLIHYGHL